MPFLNWKSKQRKRHKNKGSEEGREEEKANVNWNSSCSNVASKTISVYESLVGVSVELRLSAGLSELLAAWQRMSFKRARTATVSKGPSAFLRTRLEVAYGDESQVTTSMVVGWRCDTTAATQTNKIDVFFCLKPLKENATSKGLWRSMKVREKKKRGGDWNESVNGQQDLFANRTENVNEEEVEEVEGAWRQTGSAFIYLSEKTIEKRKVRRWKALDERLHSNRNEGDQRKRKKLRKNSKVKKEKQRKIKLFLLFFFALNSMKAGKVERRK